MYFIEDILNRLNTELFIFTDEEIKMLTKDLEYTIWKEKFHYNEFSTTGVDFKRFIEIKQNKLLLNKLDLSK